MRVCLACVFVCVCVRLCVTARVRVRRGGTRLSTYDKFSKKKKTTGGWKKKKKKKKKRVSTLATLGDHMRGSAARTWALAMVVTCLCLFAAQLVGGSEVVGRPPTASPLSDSSSATSSSAWSDHAGRLLTDWVPFLCHHGGAMSRRNRGMKAFVDALSEAYDLRRRDLVRSDLWVVDANLSAVLRSVGPGGLGCL